MSIPVVGKPAVRQSRRIKTELVRCGFLPKVLHITVQKGLQLYGDKASSNILTELLQLIDKKVSTLVEAWKLLPN